MWRHALLAVLVLIPLSGTTARQPYAYPYNMMTGEQVVQKLLADVERPADRIERDIAQAYVNGIKDGTEGVEWCFSGAILPHELNNELAWDLREKRTPVELKGNAAPLILGQLRKRYPCKEGSRR